MNAVRRNMATVATPLKNTWKRRKTHGSVARSRIEGFPSADRPLAIVSSGVATPVLLGGAGRRWAPFGSRIKQHVDAVMANVDVFMPLYIGDYLRDTADLTAEDHGAYLLILMAMWTSRTSLPKDRLRIIARLAPDRWIVVWDTLARFFVEDSAGRVIQARLMRELAAATSRRESARTNGLKGGRPRNPQQTELVTGTEPTGKPEPNPQKSSSPSPSPSPSESPSRGGAGGASANEFLAVFCEERKTRYRDKYLVRPKDAGTAKTLSGVIGIDDWRAACKRYFASRDKFYAEDRHTFAVLVAKLNSFVGDGATVVPENTASTMALQAAVMAERGRK